MALRAVAGGTGRVREGARTQGGAATPTPPSGPVAPVFTSSASQSIAENSPFALTLTTDQDPNVSYSIVGGADQSKFAVATSTVSASAFDYETPTDADGNNTYVVTVRATNTVTGLTTDQTITVTVTNLNDFAVNGLVVQGDSLMDGATTTNGPIADLFAFYSGQTGVNRATSGDVLSNIDATFATDTAPYYNATTANGLFVEGGTNDFHNGVSLASVQGYIQSIAAKGRAVGFAVGVSTITKNVSYTTGANETNRQAYNTWIRANWQTFADHFVDLEAIPQLSDPSNTTYFSDGLHLTNASNILVAEAIRVGMGVKRTKPDPFAFTDVTGATASTVYTSNTITVSGIDAASAISISGGTYSKNGGAYTSTSGTVVNGDTVSVRTTSSASAGAAVNTTLTIGGVSDTYTVTVAGSSVNTVTWVTTNMVDDGGGTVRQRSTDGYFGQSRSNETLTGDGYFEWTNHADIINAIWLSNGTSYPTNHGDIAGGWAYMGFNGTQAVASTQTGSTSSAISTVAGDVWRMQISGTSILVKKNGTTVYTMTGQTITYPVRLGINVQGDSADRQIQFAKQG